MTRHPLRLTPPREGLEPARRARAVGAAHVPPAAALARAVGVPPLRVWAILPAGGARA